MLSGLMALVLLTATAAVTPADAPLPLHTSAPLPRDLVRDRAAALRRLIPKLDDKTVNDAEAALARGEWTPTVAEALPLILERAAEHAEARKPAPALPLLLQMRPIYGDDSAYLWVAATAYLASGDLGDARAAYDEILMRRPDLVPAYLGRALAAGRMGSLPRMRADLAIARTLDARQAEEFERAHRAEIDACAAEAPKQSAADLTKELITRASAGADTAALLPIAAALHKAANLNRRIPQEVYQDGLRLHAAAIEAKPREAQPWGDMATYLYLEGIKKYGEGNINPLEWENDRLMAMGYANHALTIDAQNVTALATKGWLLEQDNQERDALAVAEAGLKIMPGYPRFAKLESTLMNVSGVRAGNAAAKECAPKTWMVTTPDWIITFSRGPNAEELARAKKFDAMSAANVAQANQAEFAAWRKYRDSVQEMGVAADYYDLIGQDDRAVPLWKRVVELDPANSEAMESMERYCRTHGDAANALEWQLRVENLYATTAAPLVRKATEEVNANAIAAAGQTVGRALAPDPTNVTNYALLGRIAMAEKGGDAGWWRLSHAGEAVEIARGRLYAADLAPEATTAVDADQAREMLAIYNAELSMAQHDRDAAAADLARKRMGALRSRLVQITAPLLQGPIRNATSAAQVQAIHTAQAAIVQASLERMRILIADGEIAAAARFCLAAGPRNGQWHPDSAGAVLDLEYPIYLYLRPRLYHYQLWHYFGPATLQTYDAYAGSHAELDPNNPPSCANRWGR